MLEWTGERFLPWLEHSTIAYEHLHRYAYASTFVKGKRVLDLASGEGYGSKMMSNTASFVTGIDIDDKAVEHAKTKYGSQNLQFLAGSISAVPIHDDYSFDVIVCFEAIEHIEDHEQLLKEVKRLLKPDGTFIVSTPNKLVYHDEARDENPFHVKELYFEEFQQILGRYFRNLQFLGQRIHPSSTIWPVGVKNNGAFEEFVLDRTEAEFRFIPNDLRVPVYFIAIASDSAVAVPEPSSVLIDHSDGLINEAKKALEWREEKISSLEEGLKWREELLEGKEKSISSLEEGLKWHEAQAKHFEVQVRQLNDGLAWTQAQLADISKQVASNEEALAWRAHQVETLEREKAEAISVLQMTQRQLTSASQQLEAIYASSGWKFVLKLRHIRDRLNNLIGRGKSRG
jgi:O-antigen biosynthesis protein